MATARYHKVKIGEHELNAETLMLGYGLSVVRVFGTGSGLK